MGAVSIIRSNLVTNFLVKTVPFKLLFETQPPCVSEIFPNFAQCSLILHYFSLKFFIDLFLIEKGVVCCSCDIEQLMIV